MNKIITSIMKFFKETASTAGVQTPSLFKSFYGAPELLNSETTSLDRVKTNLRVATQVVPGVGRNMNSYGNFTTESFPVPMYDEGISINAFDGLARLPGENPFNDSVDLISRVVRKANDAQMSLLPKFDRAEELQAVAGILNAKHTLAIPLKNDLTDETVVEIDFGRDSNLSDRSVSTSWSDAASDIIGDVEGACQALVDIGYAMPSVLLCSSTDFQNMLNNTKVKERLNLLKLDNGSIVMPKATNNGAVVHGVMSFGAFKLEIWTYDAKYENASGTLTRYLPVDRVCIGDPSARRDVVYAAIPMLQQVEGIGKINIPVKASRLPYFEADSKSACNIAGVKSRPLYIPTAVNTFAVIDTTV